MFRFNFNQEIFYSIGVFNSVLDRIQNEKETCFQREVILVELIEKKGRSEPIGKEAMGLEW